MIAYVHHEVSHGGGVGFAPLVRAEDWARLPQDLKHLKLQTKGPDVNIRPFCELDSNELFHEATADRAYPEDPDAQKRQRGSPVGNTGCPVW